MAKPQRMVVMDKLSSSVCTTCIHLEAPNAPDASKCMHVVHSVGFRAAYLMWVHEVGSNLDECLDKQNCWRSLAETIASSSVLIRFWVVCPPHQPAMSPINVSHLGGRDGEVLGWGWLRTSWVEESCCCLVQSRCRRVYSHVGWIGWWHTQWHNGADTLEGTKYLPMCHCSHLVRVIVWNEL